jgi:hypothetical protein
MSVVNKYWHPDTDAFRKLGVEPPQAQAHGTEEYIESRMTPLKVKKWELNGNTLVGITEEGVRMAQQIPTDMILTGTDDEGMPILEKISLKPRSQNQIYF